ncbi:unnamed protein product, partial [Prunus brigantina]
KKIWGGSFAGGESSAVETQNREKGGEASGIRNKKRKEKKSTLNAVDYVQVRLWRLSLLDVKLDTLCGTNEEGTRFSNSFDVANESTMLLASEETDPKYLLDMVLSLIADGKDTTASTFTWFIYMLCKHLHIQEKISQEFREATNLKDNSSIDELSDNLTEEPLEKMQYLLAVLNETTRLYPALPLNGKVCFSNDTRPDGFSVKTEEFQPERWLDENGLFQQESPFKFTAFS